MEYIIKIILGIIILIFSIPIKYNYTINGVINKRERSKLYVLFIIGLIITIDSVYLLLNDTVKNNV